MYESILQRKHVSFNLATPMARRENIWIKNSVSSFHTCSCRVDLIQGEANDSCLLKFIPAEQSIAVFVIEPEYISTSELCWTASVWCGGF